MAEVNNAAKAAEENPAAQAAARAVGQAAAAIYTPTHSLGLAFYGSAAVAYDRAGPVSYTHLDVYKRQIMIFMIKYNLMK